MLPALDERGLREHAVSNRILFALGGPFANVVAAFTGLLALGVIELGLDAGEAAVFATTGVWTSLEQIAAALPTLLTEPSQLSGIVLSTREDLSASDPDPDAGHSGRVGVRPGADGLRYDSGRRKNRRRSIRLTSRTW